MPGMKNRSAAESTMSDDIGEALHADEGDIVADIDHAQFADHLLDRAGDEALRGRSNALAGSWVLSACCLWLRLVRVDDANELGDRLVELSGDHAIDRNLFVHGAGERHVLENRDAVRLGDLPDA